MAVSTPTDDSIAPKSTHVSDPALQPFLRPTFDPVDYFNATLPPLSLSSAASRPLKQSASASLADLSTHTQDLLSQLNAHTTRLSIVLTQLTDDILRSGGRLAYEVEVLRGEIIGLTDTLTDTLQTSISKFLPSGISLPQPSQPPDTSLKSPASETTRPELQDADPERPPDAEAEGTTPPYISELRTLSTIRTRLEAVIKVFGEAMRWNIPPSEISLASSLISVSAPDATSSSPDLERKGREFAEQVRTEISELITGDDAGSNAALVRIQALRDLATVWKGTAEEKARIKFVDSLVKLAEDKQKVLEKEANQRQRGTRQDSLQQRAAPPPPTMTMQRSGGFLDNLQRIRGNILE
ncbi:hypothetical protein CC78DRAFT_535165 [Lojkania enalia]|uniref:Uncharacterized protein n=1 Tax=Lojkania enalia TaxID=147567 RepID=A0A9P4K4Z6_9PLEO|nr:hypothetical protein CC78DRAFT_535165 [Didymosphaeria enalia]